VLSQITGDDFISDPVLYDQSKENFSGITTDATPVNLLSPLKFDQQELFCCAFRFRANRMNNILIICNKFI